MVTFSTDCSMLNHHLNSHDLGDMSSIFQASLESQNPSCPGDSIGDLGESPIWRSLSH